MKIVCISDTHCMLNQIELPKGDMIIHAGDALSSGTYSEWLSFIAEYKELDYEHKIYVPGNHDKFTERYESEAKEECKEAGIIYLNDSAIEIEGLKFWGSAITPRFHNWAWNRDSGECGTSRHKDHREYQPIQPHWDMIPEDTDVLITHGPPKGIMDVSVYDGAFCGCPRLLEKVQEIKPKYHIFGHIHQHWGTEKHGDTTFINASNCTEQYRPTNEPIVIEVEVD